MPETKGLTLEEMDEVFGDADGISARDMERQAAIAARIGLDAFVAGEKVDRFEVDDGGAAREKSGA